MSTPMHAVEPVSTAVLHGRLSALSARWGLPVALVLARGPHRYSEIARALPGTAPKTLTHSLGGLRATGVVTLDDEPGAPRRYALTPEGRRLVGALVRASHGDGVVTRPASA